MQIWRCASTLMIYKSFDENEERCVKNFGQKTWREETTLKNFAGERERGGSGEREQERREGESRRGREGQEREWGEGERKGGEKTPISKKEGAMMWNGFI